MYHHHCAASFLSRIPFTPLDRCPDMADLDNTNSKRIATEPGQDQNSVTVATQSLGEHGESHSGSSANPSHVSLGDVLHGKPSDADLQPDAPEPALSGFDLNDDHDLLSAIAQALGPHVAEEVVTPPPPTPRMSHAKLSPRKLSIDRTKDDEEEDMRRAIALSLGEPYPPPSEEDPPSPRSRFGNWNRSGTFKATPLPASSSIREVDHHLDDTEADEDMFSCSTPIPSIEDGPLLQAASSSDRERRQSMPSAKPGEHLRQSGHQGPVVVESPPLRVRSHSVSSTSPGRRLSLPPTTYSHSDKAQKQREATPLFSNNVPGHGMTTYGLVPSDRTLKVKDSSGFHANHREQDVGIMTWIEGSKNGHFLDTFREFRQIVRDNQEELLDSEEGEGLRMMLNEQQEQRLAAPKREAEFKRIAMENVSTHMTETWGPSMPA